MLNSESLEERNSLQIYWMILSTCLMNDSTVVLDWFNHVVIVHVSKEKCTTIKCYENVSLCRPVLKIGNVIYEVKFLMLIIVLTQCFN